MTTKANKFDRIVELNGIIKQLCRWADFKTRKLVYHLYDKGYTVEEIANIWGVTKQGVAIQYPKERREEVNST